MVEKNEAMIDENETGYQRENVPPPTEARQIPPDELYYALASARRRQSLAVLLEGETTVDDLATILTGWDATETKTMQGAADRERIRLELEHTHLPLLADTGLVAYDPHEATVSLEALGETVRSVIEQSVELETEPTT